MSDASTSPADTVMYDEMTFEEVRTHLYVWDDRGVPLPLNPWSRDIIISCIIYLRNYERFFSELGNSDMSALLYDEYLGLSGNEEAIYELRNFVVYLVRDIAIQLEMHDLLHRAGGDKFHWGSLDRAVEARVRISASLSGLPEPEAFVFDRESVALLVDDFDFMCNCGLHPPANILRPRRDLYPSSSSPAPPLNPHANQSSSNPGMETDGGSAIEIISDDGMTTDADGRAEASESVTQSHNNSHVTAVPSSCESQPQPPVNTHCPFDTALQTQVRGHAANQSAFPASMHRKTEGRLHPGLKTSHDPPMTPDLLPAHSRGTKPILGHFSPPKPSLRQAQHPEHHAAVHAGSSAVQTQYIDPYKFASQSSQPPAAMDSSQMDVWTAIPTGRAKSQGSKGPTAASEGHAAGGGKGSKTISKVVRTTAKGGVAKPKAVNTAPTRRDRAKIASQAARAISQATNEVDGDEIDSEMRG